MSLDQTKTHNGLLRDDILKFPFPYKLWIVVNLPSVEFLHWNIDGTIIQINISRMQEYLHSSRSVFVVKTSAKFLQHLEDFQFERRHNENAQMVPEVELSYQHRNFQRHRLDLVAQIRRVTFFNLDNAQTAEIEASTEVKSARMRGDLCFFGHGFLTEMQKKRIQNETILAFSRETKILQEKLKRAEAASNSGLNNKRGRSACLEKEQIVMLPKSLYENPHDSVLAGKGGFQGSSYGGYYGNCTIEQIEKFFGDYLPKYSDGGVLKVKKFKEAPDQGVGNFRTIPTPIQSNMESEIFNTVPSEIDNTMEVDVFTTNASNPAEALMESSNLNISATFNCNNGAVEYNVTECTDINALYNNDPDPVKEMILPETQALEVVETNNQTEENKDFYDDFRATFELLQNQSY